MPSSFDVLTDSDSVKTNSISDGIINKEKPKTIDADHLIPSTSSKVEKKTASKFKVFLNRFF